MKLNDSKTIRAWCMYDWANSAYALVITSAIFPVYFENITNPTKADHSLVKFFGVYVENTALYSYCISTSFFIVMLMSPFLSALADYSGRKKMFMKIFCYIGSASCCGLFYFTPINLSISMLLFIGAGVGFSGSLVFYNAFLPEIVSEDQLDKVSAKGFSFGYIGSVLLLVFNLLMISFPAWFGLEGHHPSLPARISFLTVGIWWFGFAQISFSKLEDVQTSSKDWLASAVKSLKHTISEIKTSTPIKIYLTGFFFYNMGVQTVMYLATLFGSKVLKLESHKLIFTILLLQLVAILGAIGFSRLSKRIGNIVTIQTAIVVWIGICIAAFKIGPGEEYAFYILAVFVGMVMGGIQSMSRSTYAKLIPQDTKEHATFFSVFDVTEKLSIVLGTASFGFIDHLTNSMNNSALALGIYFIIGFIILIKLHKKAL